MKFWKWVLIGVVLGLAVGLIYTWLISPPEYYNTYPPLMGPAYRKDWIAMTALAYGAEGDWARTQLRLQGLPKAEIQQVLRQVLEDAASAGRPILLLQRLAHLGQVYEVRSPAVDIYAGAVTAIPPTLRPTQSPTPIPPTATLLPPTPVPTVTPSPTVSPSPTPPYVSPYKVISQTLACADAPLLAVSLLISHTVEVRGRERSVQEPQPGRELWLLWEDGADHAFTGFKPEQGLGYADFVIAPGRVYKLYIGAITGVPIATLQVTPCTPEEGAGWATYSLIILEVPLGE